LLPAFAAFDPEKNPLEVPIVQVSLFDNEDHDLHYRMGEALQGLRDEGILIVGTGMAVHNLRDYVAILGTDKTMPYVNPLLLILLLKFISSLSLSASLLLMLTFHLRSYAYTFDEALKEAATAKPEERRGKMAGLMKRSDVRLAHPTLDHILPIYVVAGAAGSEVGKRLWTMPDGSLSWAQYRFGEVPGA
jgi:4,5-DOPA dioxygenase extradiol